MGLLDYFRILNALVILFLLFVCMNYVPNQNGEVLEETLVGFNSDDVKTPLKGLRCFKMTLPVLQVLQKSLLIPLSLCYTQYRVLRMVLEVKASHSSWYLGWFSGPVCYIRVHVTYRSK